MGVSRHVFVNRFNLLGFDENSNLLSHPCLCNVAIGIGEWFSAENAKLKAWPLYCKFDGGRIPSFIFELQRKKDVLPSNIFSDNSFILTDDGSYSTECKTPTGTPQNSTAFQINIRCEVESLPRKP